MEKGSEVNNWGVTREEGWKKKIGRDRSKNGKRW